MAVGRFPKANSSKNMQAVYDSLIPQIDAALPGLDKLHCLLGFDGTVDIICKPVEMREGAGDQFKAFSTIRDFGQRVIDADGKSALIEIVAEREKIGGNGPIMANALAESGLPVDYIGTLGKPDIHPAYCEFAKRLQVHSVANPAVTHALEFSNGKVMLTNTGTYDDVSAETLEREIGEAMMTRLVEQSKLCCLLNWTCLSELNSILVWYLETILPASCSDPERIFFFDLADPSMHSDDRIKAVLDHIGHFSEYGRTILGMNFNETCQVSRVLAIDEPDSEPKSLCQALEAIRSKLGIDCAMGHPVDFAACATANGSWSVVGPHTATPKITTGAGDHLNAGFGLGMLLGFTPEDALKLGVLYSGYYVRTARPPHLNNIVDFIQILKKPSK